MLSRSRSIGAILVLSLALTLAASQMDHGPPGGQDQEVVLTGALNVIMHDLLVDHYVVKTDPVIVQGDTDIFEDLAVAPSPAVVPQRIEEVWRSSNDPTLVLTYASTDIGANYDNGERGFAPSRAPMVVPLME